VISRVHYVDPGFDEVYIHNVGRNQEEFIRACGERDPQAPLAAEELAEGVFEDL
jgi:hypothetical protein